MNLAFFFKGDDRPSHVYLLLKADRISAVESMTDIPEHIASIFDQDVTGVRLRLGKLRGLVLLPPDVDLVPNDESPANTFRVLESIARAPAMTFYVSSKTLTNAHVASLCTVPQQESWDKDAMFLSKPYDGQPGKTIDGAKSSLPAELAEGNLGHAAEDPAKKRPPPHDEPAHLPPESPAEHPAKRRKLDDLDVTALEELERVLKKALTRSEDSKRSMKEKQQAEINEFVREAEKRKTGKIARRKREEAERNARWEQKRAERMREQRERDERSAQWDKVLKENISMSRARREERNLADQILREITEAKSTMNVRLLD